MVCSCGGSCKSSDTIAGTAYTCPACGRREVIDFSARRESQPQAKDFALSMEPIEMPRRRRK